MLWPSHDLKAATQPFHITIFHMLDTSHANKIDNSKPQVKQILEQEIYTASNNDDNSDIRSEIKAVKRIFHSWSMRVPWTLFL